MTFWRKRSTPVQAVELIQEECSPADPSPSELKLEKALAEAEVTIQLSEDARQRATGSILGDVYGNRRRRRLAPRAGRL